MGQARGATPGPWPAVCLFGLMITSLPGTVLVVASNIHFPGNPSVLGKPERFATLLLPVFRYDMTYHLGDSGNLGPRTAHSRTGNWQTMA